MYKYVISLMLYELVYSHEMFFLKSFKARRLFKFMLFKFMLKREGYFNLLVYSHKFMLLSSLSPSVLF
jgi:hypothetical protein